MSENTARPPCPTRCGCCPACRPIAPRSAVPATGCWSATANDGGRIKRNCSIVERRGDPMLDRRDLLMLAAGSLAASNPAAPALAQAPAMSRITAYAFSFSGLDSGTIKLADYAGKPILVVNTASLCGYTPQY